MPELLNITQAAELMKVSRWTVHDWINKKDETQIPYVEVGPYKRKKFDQAELMEWFLNRNGKGVQ